MFNVKLGNAEFRVWFNHKKNEDENNSISHITECYITTKENKFIEIASGVAYCSKEDNFSRATGREISLGRAISTLVWLRKSEWHLIWSLYFKQMHQ